MAKTHPLTITGEKIMSEEMSENKFPRIIKMSAMTGEIKKQAQNYGLCDFEPNDLLIVKPCCWYSNGKIAHYSFEKIVGSPVTYLLNRLDEVEKENHDLISSLPSAD